MSTETVPPADSVENAVSKVSNVVVWIGAFAPIWSELLAGFFFRILDIPEEVAVLSLFCLFCNFVIFEYDEYLWKKKREEYSENFSWLIPVYLWRRGTLNKDNRAYFICWCASFIASIFLFAGWGESLPHEETVTELWGESLPHEETVTELLRQEFRRHGFLTENPEDFSVEYDNVEKVRKGCYQASAVVTGKRPGIGEPIPCTKIVHIKVEYVRDLVQIYYFDENELRGYF